MSERENSLILYQDENGIAKVSVRFYDEDLWLTENQIAEISAATQQNINQHIKNIYADTELQSVSTYKKFLLVRTEGKRRVERNIDHHNAEMDSPGPTPPEPRLTKWRTGNYNRDRRKGTAETVFSCYR